MRLNRIKALCKEMRTCVVYVDEIGRQVCFGTGCAAYPTEGVRMTEEIVQSLFGMDEKDWEKIIFQENALFPKFKAGVVALEEADIRITKGGAEYLLLVGKDPLYPGMYMLNKAFADAAVGKPEYRNYDLAETEGGTPIIVISDGMIPAGWVMPITREAVENSQQIMARLAGRDAMGTVRQDAGNDDSRAEDGEQTEMDGLPDKQPQEQQDGGERVCE